MEETETKTEAKEAGSRGHGPAKMDTEKQRVYTVAARLNREELALLDERRAVLKMQRGQYLRTAALDKLPQSIPGLNREAWTELSKSAGNLNQIARRLNEAERVKVEEILTLLIDLRRGLIGAAL